MASTKQNLDIAAPEIQPAAVYGSDGPIRLRIATGGGGQTGLLQALADGFIQDSLRTSPAFRESPFRIAWIATDTSLSFNALANRSADVSITYHPYASLVAIAQGFVDRREYVWRDAFALAGPKSNPANLPIDSTLSIYELFALLFVAATDASMTLSEPVCFLSRYDKSANNILESRIWTTVGQTPWSEPYSAWYHRYPSFPAQALKAAAVLEEYTLVDRGTWYTAPQEVRNSMILFKEGAVDGHDTAADLYQNGEFYGLNDDGLGNPAHCLLGKHAEYQEEGQMFIDWLVKEDGGRRVIRALTVGGTQVYGLPPESNEVQRSRDTDQVIDLS